MAIEALFSPAELDLLERRDLRRTTCVVFDVLRATSTMLTALANGARAIMPVVEIEEALAIRRRQPEVLLAGERGGLRIRSAQTGSVDFDLGNSPREFTRERVCGKAIVMSTTNGTRALRACAGAAATLLGSWLNLEANARWIADQSPPDLLLVCSGTLDQTALEDVLAAGALCARLQGLYPDSLPADSAEIARLFYGACENDTAGVMQHSRNARRLLAMPDLRDDVAVCMQRDAVHFVAGLSGDGWIRRIGNIRVRLTN